ncbi:MAG: hypothetical protein JOZ42_10665 [Acetobacteraceae bacterium]|nr:hypothetical protein [Acetobacteraceae bacterium]
MTGIRRLVLVWIGLLLLLAVQATLGRVLGWGNVALVAGPVMAALVAVFFMEVGRGPGAVRVFAAWGLFWLMVLIGLGILDPVTRRTVSAGPAGQTASSP